MGAVPSARAAVRGAVEHGAADWSAVGRLVWWRPPLDPLRGLGRPHRRHPLSHGGALSLPSYTQVSTKKLFLAPL